MTSPADGLHIPTSLLKPVSGPCVECGRETEVEHGDDGYSDYYWLCDYCYDMLNLEQERDHRLDSPAHTPYWNLRGGK